MDTTQQVESGDARVALVAGVGMGSDFGVELLRALDARGYTAIAWVRREEARAELVGSGFRSEQIMVVDLCDAAQVSRGYDELSARFGPVDVYVHNAARLVRGSALELEVVDFRAAWSASVETAITVGRVVLPAMRERGAGAVIYTGATASTRGSANFAAFASAKFALRGYAQAVARELGPAGVHVAHVIVDGVIWGKRARDVFEMSRADCIAGEELARVYMQLVEQPRSCWTHELDVRPYAERF